jgi:hypothetical protein
MCEELLQTNPDRIIQAGMEGYLWARHRLSHKQAGQFMISKVNENVPTPDLFPWNIL